MSGLGANRPLRGFDRGTPRRILDPDGVAVPMSAAGTVDEREKTHGKFSDTAAISQGLKITLAQSPLFDRMSPVQRESLEMICVKMARIVCGNPDFRDHWLDVAGYIQLVVDAFDGGRIHRA